MINRVIRMNLLSPDEPNATVQNCMTRKSRVELLTCHNTTTTLHDYVCHFVGNPRLFPLSHRKNSKDNDDLHDEAQVAWCMFVLTLTIEVIHNSNLHNTEIESGINNGPGFLLCSSPSNNQYVDHYPHYLCPEQRTVKSISMKSQINGNHSFTWTTSTTNAFVCVGSTALG